MLNIKPKKTTLKNGIRLVTAQNKATETVTVLMYFKTGSRFENPKEQGISHFLEHMIFKGTTKRPNSIDIAGIMDRIGAEFNAFTSIDHTGYYIKAEASHLPLLFDLLGDMLLNSKFAVQEIAREKGPVISEIRMYQENPMSFAQESAYLSLFGKTGIGRPIAGDEKTVNSLDRKKIVDYYKTHYFAHNLIVGVAGNVDPAEVQKLAEKNLSSFDGGEYHSPKKVSPDFDTYKIDLKFRPLKQVNAIFGFPAYDHNHKDLPALRMLQTILGGGMSSRLFISVRERKGLCYYIRTSSDQFEDTGAFFVESGIDAKRIDLALTTIFQELKKMKRQGPTKKEVKDALDQMKGKLMIDFEDSFTVAEYMVSQEAFKKEGPQEISTILKKYEKVTSQDIQRVAKDILRKEKLSLTLVGPFKEKEKKRFQEIIEKSF
jgi:predicted Zn-dependent peptidase